MCKDIAPPFSYRERVSAGYLKHTGSINYRNLIKVFGVSCGGPTEDRMLGRKFDKALRLYQSADTYSQTASKTHSFQYSRGDEKLYINILRAAILHTAALSHVCYLNAKV
jgi:hypothetical protein